MRLTLSLSGYPGRQFGQPSVGFSILDRHGQGLGLADDRHQLLAPRYGRVDQIPFQQRVMLHRQRNYDRRVFRALTFVDAGGIRQRDLVQFAELVLNNPTIVLSLEGIFFKVYLQDLTDSPGTGKSAYATGNTTLDLLEQSVDVVICGYEMIADAVINRLIACASVRRHRVDRWWLPIPADHIKRFWVAPRRIQDTFAWVHDTFPGKAHIVRPDSPAELRAYLRENVIPQLNGRRLVIIYDSD